MWTYSPWILLGYFNSKHDAGFGFFLSKGYLMLIVTEFF